MHVADREGGKIVEMAVVALRHDGIHRAHRAADLGRCGYGVADQRRRDRAHRERVGQPDRRLECAELDELHEDRPSCRSH
jgi:hypothetical protein